MFCERCEREGKGRERREGKGGDIRIVESRVKRRFPQIWQIWVEGMEVVGSEVGMILGWRWFVV